MAQEDIAFVGLVFDFETGGLECREDGATEISFHALRLDTLQVVDKYQSYIYPYKRQEFNNGKKAKKLTKKNEEQIDLGLMGYDEQKALPYSNITMDLLYDRGVDLIKVVDCIIDFTKRNTICTKRGYLPIVIGQNVQFDCGFLQQIFAYAGKLKELSQIFHGVFDFFGNFQPHYIDTLDLGHLTFAYDKDITSYKLEILAERLGIELDDAHDADADVTATANIVVVCANKLRNNSGESGENVGLAKAEKTRVHFKI